MGKKRPTTTRKVIADSYGQLLSSITELLDQARRSTVRTVNGILTATYWEIGRRIFEHEQGGQVRAGYGEEVMKRLALDLGLLHGRGFSRRNIEQMRNFFLGWTIDKTASGSLQARVRLPEIPGKNEETAKAQTVSALLPKAKAQTVSALLPEASLTMLVELFPLSWSQYARLLSVSNLNARSFYEEEAIRGGWSVRQLDRQIGTQFYERLAASKRKDAMLRKGQEPKTLEHRFPPKHL